MTAEPDPGWWGVVFPAAGQFRITGSTFEPTTGDGSATAEIRVDVWPQWLAIARLALDSATTARAANPAANVQPAFGDAILRELLHSMTCICAVAFTLEAFTSSVIHHQPHVLPPAPVAGSRNRGTSADGRIHQTWNRAFRLPNNISRQIRSRNGYRHRDFDTQDGAGWLAFLRGLVARGLTGVKLVTSDAHSGLVAAIGAALPGASWQRCRTHYAVNLMSITPKSSWPWVRTMLHSIYDQVDAKAVAAQFDRVIDTLAEKLPAVADHLDQARADLLAFTPFPKQGCVGPGMRTATA